MAEAATSNRAGQAIRCEPVLVWECATNRGTASFSSWSHGFQEGTAATQCRSIAISCLQKYERASMAIAGVPATPLSWTYVRTGGFASPPYDGFALIKACSLCHWPHASYAAFSTSNVGAGPEPSPQSSPDQHNSIRGVRPARLLCKECTAQSLKDCCNDGYAPVRTAQAREKFKPDTACLRDQGYFATRSSAGDQSPSA